MFKGGPVAKGLRTLIFSTLNCSSSHSSGFKPSSVRQAKFFLWVVRCFFLGISHFCPTSWLTWLKMSEIILTSRKTQIKKNVLMHSTLHTVCRDMIWVKYCWKGCTTAGSITHLSFFILTVSAWHIRCVVCDAEPRITFIKACCQDLHFTGKYSVLITADWPE